MPLPAKSAQDRNRDDNYDAKFNPSLRDYVDFEFRLALRTENGLAAQVVGDFVAIITLQT